MWFCPQLFVCALHQLQTLTGPEVVCIYSLIISMSMLEVQWRPGALTPLCMEPARTRRLTLTQQAGTVSARDSVRDSSTSPLH